MTRPPLPIDDVLPQVRAALATHGRAVLQAPPGAGKTTAVPLALLDEPWMTGGRLIMLEPRRLAARAAARRMAHLGGGRVGGLIGFRIRGESAVGPATRIEVVTEGVLTRMLASDPTLDGVAGVIFDEFHERSVVADTGLALTLRTADLLRPDLRLLVMSATLDGERVAALIGDAPVITSDGRAFPVDTRWIPLAQRTRPLDGTHAAVRRAVAETDGDVLVFVPGAGEIRRLAAALAADWPGGNPRVFGLHGGMPADLQDTAIAPSPAGTRKIVIATAVAETSLTIEGVRAVVDSGFARVPRFDIRSGMTRLDTVRVTQDAAEQRRGRAGRSAPGVCYRLWGAAEHGALLARRTPEILSADLAPLLLDLALAGVDDADALRWMDPPPPAAMAQARALLESLDAVDERGAPTPHGRRMASLGLHPRLAHLVIRGHEAGLTDLACEIAALLGERDILQSGGPDGDPDLALRIAALRGDSEPRSGVDRSRVRQVRDEVRRLRERVRAAGMGSHTEQRTGHRAAGGRVARAAPPTARGDGGDATGPGELLALAYPDRVALSAGAAGRFRMRNGRGAFVTPLSPLAREDVLAIADTDGARDDARVYLAAPLSRGALEQLFGAQATVTVAVAIDERTGTVVRTERRMLGALVLSEHSAPERDADARVAALLARVRTTGLDSIPWSDAATRTRQRIAFLHALDESWPDVSDAALLAAIDEWLAPHLHAARRWDDLAKADLGSALLALVPPPQRRHLDRLAPSHITVATGSNVPVDYSDPRAPALSVRLQELFGTAQTPAVGAGRVPLTLHLLSPAGRPIQVTRDLGRFWTGSYADVRKEMRGRYPRHSWPDDPLMAEPTRRAKPRK